MSKDTERRLHSVQTKDSPFLSLPPCLHYRESIPRQTMPK